MRILLVEDEEPIRVGLIDVLIYHGFAVEASDNGPEGLKMAQSGQFDLVLLDVMLPGMNGFVVCEKIRLSDPAQPIIMLTARNADEDIIHGLKLGADDYVSKPFSVAQLVLRVQAVLRRSNLAKVNVTGVGSEFNSGSKTDLSTIISLDNSLVIDTQNLCVVQERVMQECVAREYSVGDTEAVSFTRREMDIIVYLASHTGRPVSREELLDKVWGYAAELAIETRTVDIHIAKIRRKIERDSKHPTCLITVRGAGYRLKTLT